MTRRFFAFSAILAGAAAWLALASAAAAQTPPAECPVGYTAMTNGGVHQCVQICPLGQELARDGSNRCVAITCTRVGFVLNPATGQCGCPAGQVEKAGGEGPACITPCPAGQELARDGSNRCVAITCTRVGFVLNPATGQCGCPAGQVEKAGGEGPACVTACPAGQERAPDGSNRCVAITCTRVGFVLNPATGQCGCPAGQVEKPGGEGPACVTACPAGQERAPDGSNRCVAITCTRVGFVLNPATGQCGCPAGQVEKPGGEGPACVTACPAGQELARDGSNRCVAITCTRVGFVLNPATGQCGCPAGQVEKPGGHGPACVTPCPAGQERAPDGSNRCVAITCPSRDQVFDIAIGACACPKGMFEGRGDQAGRCINPCPRGQRVNNAGVCATDATTCAKGTALINGACINPCSDGQEIGPQGTCAAKLGTCPSGTVLINGVCANPCSDGQEIGPRGVCVSKAGGCPTGTVPACVTPCSDGQPRGADGKCPQPGKATIQPKPKVFVDPNALKCKSGFVPVDGRCVRSAGSDQGTQRIPTCPDGHPIPPNGNCGVVAPLFNPFGGLQLILPGQGQQQQKQQSETSPVTKKAPAPVVTPDDTIDYGGCGGCGKPYYPPLR